MYVQSYNLCNAGKSIYTKDILSRGGKIFLAYLLIEYVIPLFLNLVYDTQPVFRMPIYSINVLFPLFFLILVSIIGVVAAQYTSTITPVQKGPIKPLPKWSIILISLVAIYIGYIITVAELTQYRYSVSISDNTALIYAALIQLLMPAMSFWVLMTDHSLITSWSVRNIFIKVIMLLGLIFSINGLGSIFVTLLFAIIFIAPNSILGLLFIKSVKLRKHFFSTILIFILLIFIAPPVIKIGEFAKTGNQVEVNEILSTYAGFDYLVNRHSVHLSSLAASIEDGPNSSNLSIPFDTTVYRLKFLLGDPTAEKPEISTFSRLSLLQFADHKNINPKGGSSPGLFASLTMIFPFPLAAIGVFFVTFIFIKLLDYILCRQPPFSWIGAFIFAYIPFRYPTDSPLDLFIPGPILIVLLLTLLLSLRREKIDE